MTGCIRHMIALVQTETSFGDSPQTNHKGVKRKKIDRQTKEKRRKNSSVVHLVDDILCSPSVISVSSVKTDRISSCVSLPLQDDCSTDVPGDTFFFLSFFPSVSLVLSVAAIFSELYELVTTLFFFFPFLSSPPLSFSHLSPGANSTPASRQSFHLSVHLSVQPWDTYTHTHAHTHTKSKMKLQEKNYTLYFFFLLGKVTAFALVNEMQLWIERPHVLHPPTHFYPLQDWIDTGGGVVCACTTVCAPHLCVQLLCDRFPEPEPKPSPCPLAGEMASCGERWGSFTARPAEC